MNTQTKKKETICVVVVTYNRKLLLLECLESLLKQMHPLDAIYLIDNASTDGTPEVLKEKGYIKGILSGQKEPIEAEHTINMLFDGNKDRQVKVHYVRMNENTGGAGGFYEGVKRGYEKGYDWLWLMDDDAMTQENALKSLFDVYELKKSMCLESNYNDDKEFKGRYKNITTVMFVGVMINKNVVSKIGFPRKDFFIYHDDGEYSKRMLENGFELIKVRDSMIKHGDFLSRPYFSGKMFWKNIRFPNMGDEKLYYYFRNELLKYRLTEPQRYIVMIKLLKEGFKVLLLNKIQFRVFVKAFIHGVIGKSGKNNV